MRGSSRRQPDFFPLPDAGLRPQIAAQRSSDDPGPGKNPQEILQAHKLWLCLYFPLLSGRPRALDELADKASRFSPVVSVDANGALLLEVVGSLKLFGGLESLQSLIASEFETDGHRVIPACAPTARAASTYAFSFAPSTTARTSRATSIH